ncbi:MAG: Bax inhibitor-1/YccA family protein [Vicinamibacteria bacterium]|nr:Bax inhibitor-1/YccA family protein [Vicinamibacteria bacterium]
MRSANPALSDNAFRSAGVAFGAEAMTIDGAVHKTGISLLVLLAAAAFVWNGGLGDATPLAVMGGAIGGLVLALVTVFKKTWAPITTPLYAAAQGLFLGGISATYEARYPGIVINAVGLTMGTLAALLLAYRSGLIRATENFKLGIVAATGAIFLVYLVSMVLGFFGVQVPLIHGSGIVGIGFSLFVVAIAALNLVMDFDFIENAAGRAPKYMEWYAAFGLLVTLVWLYIEILRLLAKLQGRDRR